MGKPFVELETSLSQQIEENRTGQHDYTCQRATEGNPGHDIQTGIEAQEEQNGDASHSQSSFWELIKHINKSGYHADISGTQTLECLLLTCGSFNVSFIGSVLKGYFLGLILFGGLAFFKETGFRLQLMQGVGSIQQCLDNRFLFTVFAVIMTVSQPGGFLNGEFNFSWNIASATGAMIGLFCILGDTQAWLRDYAEISVKSGETS